MNTSLFGFTEKPNQNTLPTEYFHELNNAKSRVSKFMLDVAQMTNLFALNREYPVLSAYASLVLANTPTNADNRTYQFWKKSEMHDFFHKYRENNLTGDDVGHLLSDFFKVNVLRKELIDCSEKYNYSAEWLLSDQEWEIFGVKLIKSIVEKPIAIKPQCSIAIYGLAYKVHEISLVMLKILDGNAQHNIGVKCTVQKKFEKQAIDYFSHFNKNCFFRNLLISNENHVC